MYLYLSVSLFYEEVDKTLVILVFYRRRVNVEMSREPAYYNIVYVRRRRRRSSSSSSRGGTGGSYLLIFHCLLNCCLLPGLEPPRPRDGAHVIDYGHGQKPDESRSDEPRLFRSVFCLFFIVSLSLNMMFVCCCYFSGIRSVVNSCSDEVFEIDCIISTSHMSTM